MPLPRTHTEVSDSVHVNKNAVHLQSGKQWGNVEALPAFGGPRHQPPSVTMETLTCLSVNKCLAALGVATISWQYSAGTFQLVVLLKMDETYFTARALDSPARIVGLLLKLLPFSLNSSTSNCTSLLR